MKLVYQLLFKQQMTPFICKLSKHGLKNTFYFTGCFYTMKIYGIFLFINVMVFIGGADCISQSSSMTESVVINEFMASNGAVLADDFGEYEDWIELYNPTEKTIDLSGAYLSDDESNITRWRFPEGITLASNEHMIIWASGRNRRDVNAPLHTNFRISRLGEPLILTDSDGKTVLDYVPPVKLERNVSYGRLPDGSENWEYFGGDYSLEFYGTTPGASNEDGSLFHYSPDTPSFSRKGGWYSQPFYLILSAPPGKSIYYTLDGSEPHPEENPDNTFQYSGFLWIHDRTSEQNTLSMIQEASPFWRIPSGQTRKLSVIRARSYCQETGTYSQAVTHTYGIGRQYQLPVVSLTMHKDYLFDHDTGIYVMGRYWEEAEEVGFEDSHLQFPANYRQRGRSWEKPPAKMTSGFNYRCAWLGIIQKGQDVYAEKFAPGETPWTAVTSHVELPTGQKIDVHSTGGKLIELNPAVENSSYISINGIKQLEVSRGIGVVVLDPDGIPSKLRIFDTYRCFQESRELTALLETIPEDWYIIIATHDEFTTNLTQCTLRSLQNLGFQKVCEEIDDICGSVSFEYIGENGKRAFAQDIGVRIHGGVTRSYPNKSFRLYARSDYAMYNTLDHAFFPGLEKRGTGKPLNSFKRLILRNSGNDSERWTRATFFRDAFMQELISGSGLDYQSYQPVILFLNGEYWGIYNLRERLDHHYLASHYDIDDEDIVILERNAELDHGGPEDRTHYLEMLDYLNKNDIRLPEHYEHIKKQMDIENFILYQAYQIFIRNTDWPGNNITFWRYTGDEPPSDASGRLDGRWRWMVFDTDFGFGLRGGSDAYTHDTLSFATEKGGTSWPNPDWSTYLLRTLLKNETFRHTFISTFAGLLNTWFQPERVKKVIDEFQILYQPEMPENIERWRVPNSFHQWINNVDRMRTFAERRPEYMRQHIEDYFELPGTFRLELDVNNSAAGTISVDREHLHLFHPALEEEIYPWEGIYFLNIPVTLKAHPNPGYTFTGWQGSLEKSSSTITLTPSEDIFLKACFEWVGFEGDEMNPEPHILRENRYTFDFWSPHEPEGIFPPHMIFQQSSLTDPGLHDKMTEPYHIPFLNEGEHEYHEDDLESIGFPYNLTRRTRINGLNHHGISMINTGRGRDLGAVVLALDTRDISRASVSFTAGTVRPNTRVYAWRLQYRKGTDFSAPFRDLKIKGNPVEYVRQDVVRSKDFGPILLPDKLMGLPYLQLRWKFYHVEGQSGPRAELRLDNIMVQPVERTSIENKRWNFYR